MYSWHAWLLLLRPDRVQRRLDQLVAQGVIDRAPNLWQVEQGVLRMWHRLFFRPETIGNSSDHPVRDTRRARFFHQRAVRGAVLWASRAIAPFDHSGLAQPTWRLCRHLLAAHHDGNQFAYDVEILQAQPEVLRELLDKARAIAEDRDPRAGLWKDVAVFDGYHSALAAALEKAIAGEDLVSDTESRDPDISFSAWVQWCLSQPASPKTSLKAKFGDKLNSVQSVYTT